MTRRRARQGDFGTQYRLFMSPTRRLATADSLAMYLRVRLAARRDRRKSRVRRLLRRHHQQYLAKIGGYCGLGGTIACPLTATAEAYSRENLAAG
jgi:hypothetical protein